VSRAVELGGADNVRDLGGLPAAEGRVTRHGRLFRGELLPSLVEDDVDALIRKAGP
jgi:protein-tyrosine phosphatase